MRDRLIEVLGNFPIWHSTMRERWMPEAVERLADYLLSEGVIVPPCKDCPKSERVKELLFCSVTGKIILPQHEHICICRGKRLVESERE